MAASTTTGEQQALRAPPGGAATVVLGSDASAWSTTSISHCKFEASEVPQPSQEARQPVGGVDSVQLGGEMASVAAEELLARPSPGGADSIAFGEAAGNSLSAAQLLARASPGGADSVDFGKAPDAISSQELLARPWPGGSASLVLGGDSVGWTTNSQAVGVGSAEAAAAVQEVPRPAPGGADSIDFCAAPTNTPAKELLARPSPGGADSVNFAPARVEQIPAEVLLARSSVGGSATVVLGGDSGDWSTNSQVHGVGSIEAIAASEARIRPSPGGYDSVDFAAADRGLSSEVLMARPSPGGQSDIMLGAENGEWKTNSSAVGVGSLEAVKLCLETRLRPPPGGMDSVAGITVPGVAPTAEELLERPAIGGQATVVLGGDNNDWATTSAAHCDIPLTGDHTVDAVARPAPGGVDSVVLGGVETSTLTVEQLLARPAPGGAATVDFGATSDASLPAAELLVRPSPGGATNIVLGSVSGAWATSSQKHDGVQDTSAPAQTARPPPGGVDSVSIGIAKDSTASVETLLARPSPGGAATVVLGGDDANWATNSSAMGAGCADAASTGAPAATAHNCRAAADSVKFGQAGETTPARSMRVMCSPSTGASSVTLEDEGFCPQPGTSSNRFACGSNQNQGNWITDRSTTRLHQAPGGNSSISLSDGSIPPLPEVSVSSNRFASGSNQNQGNFITDRSTTRLRQAPGGKSTISLTHVQDENVNSANLQQTSQDGEKASDAAVDKVRQAPGGTATVVLG